jgi:hypothetical protein
MDNSYIQAVLWIFSVVLLLAYMNRRRRRRMMP